MNDSIFGPNSIKERTTGAFATGPALVEPGPYNAVVVHDTEQKEGEREPMQIKERVINYTDKKTGEPVERTIMEIWFRIQEPGNEAADGRHVRYTAWTDKDESRQHFLHGPGKNRDLGQLREALGQNDEEQAWSPVDMKGQSCKIFVEHEVGKDGKTRAKVTGVARLN